MRLVIFAVFVAVLDSAFFDQGFQNVHTFFARFPIDKHGANAGAQEMIRATGAEIAKFLSPFRAGERQRVFVIGIVRDDAPV